MGNKFCTALIDCILHKMPEFQLDPLPANKENCKILRRILSINQTHARLANRLISLGFPLDRTQQKFPSYPDPHPDPSPAQLVRDVRPDSCIKSALRLAATLSDADREAN